MKCSHLLWVLVLSVLVQAPRVWAQQNPAPAATSAGAQQPSPPGVAAPGDAPKRVYIAIGDPNLRKVLLAIDRPEGTGAVIEDFYQTLISDMDFTDLFDLLPQSRFPTERGGVALPSIKMDGYKVAGAEFLIKSAIRYEKGAYEAEVHLYDVARNVQVMGRLYPLTVQVEDPGRELAHYAGDEIIQALTGERGIFRTRLLMSCGMKTKEIYIMDFDGQNVRRISRDNNFALSPSWSPDGRRILFTSYKPAIHGGPLNPNLYMVDLANNRREVISAAQGLNTGGVFSPDGQKIAYTFSVKGKAEIFILDLAGKTRRPVTKTYFFSVEPTWSPDGRQLAYSSSKTGQPHIYVDNTQGTAPKRLTFAGRYNSSPSWSPKGDRIAFCGQENTGNNFNIFLIDPSGSNLVRLTDDNQSSENPSYSPDGRFIAFSSNRDGNYRVYTMTGRGTRIRALSPTSLGHCKQPAWSPRL